MPYNRKPVRIFRQVATLFTECAEQGVERIVLKKLAGRTHPPPAFAVVAERESVQAWLATG